MQKQAYDSARLSWPTDWAAEFGREAPLYLEIGFGNAQFLRHLAEENSDANILGIEISLPSIKKAERKIKNNQLSNLRVVHGDARLLLWAGCMPKSLAKVYINFPDPWHKAAHEHRKLINDRFLLLLATRLHPQGEVTIATDDAGYQIVIEECLLRTPYVRSRLEDNRPYVTEDKDRFRTKYEQRAIDQGRTCKYFKWVRNSLPVEDLMIFAVPQELEMPHVVIKSSLTLNEISGRYEAQRYSGPVPVRFMRLFYTDVPSVEDEKSRGLLIETHIAEEPLAQRIGLFVQERDDDEIILAAHEMGFPRPTEGVHLAVSRLARWLLDLEDGMILKRHNLSCDI